MIAIGITKIMMSLIYGPSFSLRSFVFRSHRYFNQFDRETDVEKVTVKWLRYVEDVNSGTGLKRIDPVPFFFYYAAILRHS